MYSTQKQLTPFEGEPGCEDRRDGPASGEKRSHSCRFKVLGYFGRRRTGGAETPEAFEQRSPSPAASPLALRETISEFILTSHKIAQPLESSHVFEGNLSECVRKLSVEGNSRRQKWMQDQCIAFEDEVSRTQAARLSMRCNSASHWTLGLLGISLGKHPCAATSPKR